MPQTDRPIRIGTRGSALALAQAGEVRARLMAAHGFGEDAFVVEVIATSGDRIQNRPLSEVGGKGLFTKEIEDALLLGRIDLAVHSAKDVATRLPAGLHLSAVLPREDVRDAFIGRAGARTIAELSPGARVGTASLRRGALLRRERPDVEIVTFRGNVQTRLAKLARGEVEGTLLALAGLKRLGLQDAATEVLDAARFLPAPGQGAICIESRAGDERVTGLVAAINDKDAATALAAERAFLAVLDGSCRTPIAGLARIEAGALAFRGAVLTPDGARLHAASGGGPAEQAEAVGQEAARTLLREAGTEFFRDWTR